MQAGAVGLDPDRQRNGAGKSWRTPAHLLLIVAVALLVCWPVLIHGVPNLAHDSPQHARWDKSFAQQLWAGEWYPRWLASQNGGLGAPVFFFYPPLPSYASSVFRPLLAARDPGGWLQVGCGCALALVLSGLAAYFWLRSLTTPGAALFGAILYVIAPYHLAIDLYNRGAVSEFWSFVWLPLVMLAVDGVIQRRRWAFAGLSCSYALLLFSHFGVTLCFSAVPVAAAFLLSERGRKMRTTLTTAVAMTLGAGLASVFVLPVLLGEHNIHMELILDDFCDYRKWFLFQIPSPLDFKTRVLFVTLSMVIWVCGLSWLCLRFRPQPRERSRVAFYLGVGMTAFFFTTQASAPLWRVLPYLKDLQFPYRFDTVLTLAVAAVSALAFSYIRQPGARPWLVVASLFLVAWMAADGWAAVSAFSEWRQVPSERAQRVDPLQHERFLWPQSASLRLLERSFLEQYLAAHPARSLELRSAADGQPIGRASVADWQPRRIVLDVDAPEPGRLTINHLYYAGWRGRIGASGQAISAKPTSPDGMIEMDVPRGHYSLSVELAREGPEKAGIAISICSALIVLVIAAAGVIGRRQATSIS